MSVDVVLKGSQRFESSLADRTLVRPLLGVRLHVPRQEVALRRRVVAVVTHVGLSHLEKADKNLFNLCTCKTSLHRMCR